METRDYDAGQALPLGVPVEFETDMFIGRILCRIRDSKPREEDSERHAAYFEGKKRFYHAVVQGQFKDENLTFSDLVFGEVYSKPLKGVPRGVMGKLYKKVNEAMCPGAVFDLDSDTPTVLAPAGGCQKMSIDLPGQEPDIAELDSVVENTALLGEVFESEAKRRKYLSKPSNAAKYKINTEQVYTFEVYDHTMNYGTFHQHMGAGFKIDMVPSLNGQAMSFAMFTRCLRRIYRFPLWHERLVENQGMSKQL